MFTVKGVQPAEKRARLNDEEYAALKKKLNERKKILQNFPLFKLIASGVSASLSTDKGSRIPISVKDVQCLLLCSIVGDLSFRELHKWFLLLKWIKIPQTVVLVVDNVSINSFEENLDMFPQTLATFDDGVEMMNPYSDGISLNVALAYSPISNLFKKRIGAVYSSLKEALNDGHVYSITDFIDENCNRNETTQNESEQPAEGEKNNGGCIKKQLVLSALQLVTERYPVPGVDSEGFVFTKDKYEPVTENSPMFAIDCEFCLCNDGSLGLARVAIVDENLDPVYHAFVLPDKPIKDYLTKWSGITPQLLAGVQKKLHDVQQDIRKLLPPDAILVGHALNGDLLALQLLHPYIIDSSVIYNITGCRSMKSKLQFLSAVFCNRTIQSPVLLGHDPNEDALAAMELVLLKVKKGLKYGDSRFSLSGLWDGPSKEKVLSVISSSIFDCRLREAAGDEKDLDVQGVLLMKFFTFIHSQNKSSVLITHPTHETAYRPKMPVRQGLFLKSDEIKVPPVHIRVEPKLQDVVTSLQSQLDKNFIFVHTAVDKEKTEKESFTELDQVIADMYNKIQANSLMVVIFGGKTNPSIENGVCMIRVKKPRPEELFPHQ